MLSSSNLGVVGVMLRTNSCFIWVLRWGWSGEVKFLWMVNPVGRNSITVPCAPAASSRLQASTAVAMFISWSGSPGRVGGKYGLPSTVFRCVYTWRHPWVPSPPRGALSLPTITWGGGCGCVRLGLLLRECGLLRLRLGALCWRLVGSWSGVVSVMLRVLVF